MKRNRLAFSTDTPPTLHQWIEWLTRSEDTHEPRLRPGSPPRSFTLRSEPPHRRHGKKTTFRYKTPPPHRVQAFGAVLLLEQLLDGLQIQDSPAARHALTGLRQLLSQASVQAVNAARLRTLLLELAAAGRDRHGQAPRLSEEELTAAALLAFELPQTPDQDLPLQEAPGLDQVLNAPAAPGDQSLQACFGECLARLGANTDYSEDMLDALKDVTTLLDDALGEASAASGRLDLSPVDVSSLDELALLGVTGAFIARRRAMKPPLTALTVCEELEDLPLYFRAFSGLTDITLPNFASEDLNLGDFEALQRVTFTGEVLPALRQPGRLTLPHPHCEVVWPKDTTSAV